MSTELSLRDVRARYGHVEVLHGISLDFPAGAITALLGPNGAGKSTLLNVIAGTMPAASGSVVWHGQEVKQCSAYDRARRGMMLVPERRGIFPDLTVADNLAVFSESGVLDLDSALSTFPILRQRQGQRAGSLSGGEQQMLAMSRVLIQKPSLLLLDEISFGLAPQVAAALFDVVSGLATSGTTVVLVEQYVAEATRLADIVYVLARGQVAFAGDSQEAMSAERLPGYVGAQPTPQQPR